MLLPALSAQARARRAAALCCCLSLPALAVAQYQCTDAAGRIVYQQAPCAAGLQQRILAPANPPQTVPLTVPSTPSLTPSGSGSPRAGLRSVGPLPTVGDVGPVSVGMTQSQVLAVLGPPERSRTVQDGASVYSHWGYQRERSRLVVVMERGVVRAVQADEGAPAPRACASAAEIREIEIDISKIQNRDNPLVQEALQRRLSDARACRGAG